MIVVAIIAIGLAIAGFSINRSRRRATLERTSAEMRSMVERVRALAAVAGSRLSTARVVPDASCAGGQQLWITINPGTGTAVIPVGIDYDDALDVLNVRCRTWDVDVESQGVARIAAASTPLQFGFAPTGRLITPGVDREVFVYFEHTLEPGGFGFRILPSGVLCAATAPPPTAIKCDEDAT